MNNGSPFSGQVPEIGQRESQAKAAIVQQIGQMTREIYVGAAALRLQHHGPVTHNLEDLARRSHEAAKAFFQGLGVVQFGKEAT